MSDITGTLGEFVQTAFTARAIEPNAGESMSGEAGHTHERACLNCGTALVGSHCHACGQPAHVHRTLGAFFHDLLHGVFHFEGKIWRTLPMLAWQPGRLTREYIDGRRASYVSPIALFLFVVFLTFALFNLIVPAAHIGGKDSIFTPVAAQAETATSKDIARLEKEIATATAKGEQTGALEGQLAGARGALEGIRSAKNGELPVKIAENDGPTEQDLVNTVNAAWAKVGANPDLAIYKLQSSAYKYSWLLIPLSVPFVWLLFPFRRRFHLYDHTVFVTYSISFMLILLGSASMLSLYNFGTLSGLLMLYVPLHMYRHLHGTYQTSRAGAIWRTVALLLFSTFALTLFVVAILAVVATG
jgi:hypothetical protein